MNNVSTNHRGAVSTKNLAGDILAGKQFHPAGLFLIDNLLIIKIRRDQKK